MILAQLFPMFPLDTPEYIKKLKVYRRFQGGDQKITWGRNGLRTNRVTLYEQLILLKRLNFFSLHFCY